jgi:hypothetical protein
MNPKPKSAEDEDKVDEGEFIKGVGSGGIGKIKIADFGMSKVLWDTQTATPCGTVGYAAPEIVKDERYSKSVDMWAKGCVLYTLLCGFPPFHDESLQALNEKIAHGQYTFLSPWWDDISKLAQDLISHLLTVDPSKRYTIQEFLVHPWIWGTEDPTYAALAAQPLASPAVERDKQLGPDGQLRSVDLPLLESPGARRMDFRSLGTVNPRDVFDVSYAVRRQDEEGKRRKKFKQAAMDGLNAIDDEYPEEDDESVEDAGAILAKVAKPTADSMQDVEQGLGNANLNSGKAAAEKQVGSGRKGNFELRLNGATLLRRRGKVRGQVAPPIVEGEV